MSDVIEKAKLMTESEAINDIIEARRIAATDKATEDNFNRALDHVMNRGSGLGNKSLITGKKMPPFPPQQPQPQMPQPGMPPQQPGMPQQPPPFDANAFVQSLPDEHVDALMDALKKRVEAQQKPVDQPSQMQNPAAGRPF